MRGWRGYFGFCETPDLLIQLTRWVRLRLRAALWRQWKTQRRRRAMLIQLGVRGKLADSTAASGRGPLASRPFASSELRAFECLFPRSRSSFAVRQVLAQTSRTAVYGP